MVIINFKQGKKLKLNKSKNEHAFFKHMEVKYLMVLETDWSVLQLIVIPQRYGTVLLTWIYLEVTKLVIFGL